MRTGKTMSDEPTFDQIRNLAEFIVNGMLCQELAQHVYEDIYSLMLHDADLFHANLDDLDLKPEDFTNEKFRGEDAV